MRVPLILSQKSAAKNRQETVHTLYFAQLRETLGRSDEDVHVPEGTTLKQLFTFISKGEPRLREFEDSLVFFLNEERATGNEILLDGDRVALCPPVSGG